MNKKISKIKDSILKLLQSDIDDSNNRKILLAVTKALESIELKSKTSSYYQYLLNYKNNPEAYFELLYIIYTKTVIELISDFGEYVNKSILFGRYINTKEKQYTVINNQKKLNGVLKKYNIDSIDDLPVRDNSLLLNLLENKDCYDKLKILEVNLYGEFVDVGITIPNEFYIELIHSIEAPENDNQKRKE